MSTQQQVLDRLGTLRPRDRAWILKRLSPHERTALMDVAMRTAPGAAVASTMVTARAAPASVQKEHVTTLRLADTDVIANVLRREPPWLVAAVLAIEDWPWTQEVLQLLPLPVRNEVLHLSEKPIALTPALREALIQNCAQELTREQPIAKPTRLRVLLRNIEAALVSKRLARL